MKILRYNQFENNERINFKGLALGVLSALAVSCSSIEVEDRNGERINAKEYVGDGVVKKITITGGEYQEFIIEVKDINGNKVEFYTNELTYNVGDKIHVDAVQKIAYPLDDPTNNSSLKNN